MDIPDDKSLINGEFYQIFAQFSKYDPGGGIWSVFVYNDLC